MATVVDLITQEAQRQGVDPSLAIEVARAESGLDPNTPDSSAGAIGLFQLEPATAAQLGVDPRDPAQNMRGGIAYIRQLLAQFGNVANALGAYNWGPGNLSKALAQWGAQWISHAPTETRNYVGKILANLSQYKTTITPASVANGVTQLVSGGLLTLPQPAPPDDGSTPPPDDHSLEGILILTGLALGVYIVAEAFRD